MSEQGYERYDFRRPVLLSRAQAAAFEVAFDAFSREWSAALTAATRQATTVAVAEVGVSPLRDVVGDLPGRIAVARALPLEDPAVPALVLVAVPDALRWVVRMLGGSAATLPDRGLTLLERNLLRPVLSDAVDAAAAAVAVPLHFDRVDDAINDLDETAIVLSARLVVRVGDEPEAQVLVTLPAGIVLPELGRVAPQTPETNRERIAQTLGDIPVEVALRIPAQAVSATDVLAIAVGSIVPIAHPRTAALDLVVDGDFVARAAMGSNGSRLACVVVGGEDAE